MPQSIQYASLFQLQSVDVRFAPCSSSCVLRSGLVQSDGAVSDGGSAICQPPVKQRIAALLHLESTSVPTLEVGSSSIVNTEKCGVATRGTPHGWHEHRFRVREIDESREGSVPVEGITVQYDKRGAR